MRRMAMRGGLLVAAFALSAGLALAADTAAPAAPSTVKVGDGLGQKVAELEKQTQAAVEKLLEEKVSFDFVDLSIMQVCQQLRDATKLQFSPQPAEGQQIDWRNLPKVTLKVENVTLKDALAQIEKIVGVKIVVQGLAQKNAFGGGARGGRQGGGRGGAGGGGAGN